MKKLDLSIYKKSIKYLFLYDYLIKKETINKDAFLKEHNIVPNSYRRAKVDDQKVGKKIVDTLNEYYNLKQASDDEILYIEELANSIHFDLYYKITKRYDQYLKEIERLLECKYNIYPVLLLLKLYLKINDFSMSDDAVNINIDLYKEVKNYTSFFNDDLLKIFTYMQMAFEKNSINYLLAHEQDDAIYYFMAGFRSIKNEKYVDCLYFCEKAESILLKEYNFMRLIYLNFNVMSCLLHMKNYTACLELAKKEMLVIESLNLEGYEKKNAFLFYVIALIGVKDYKPIIDIFKDKNDFGLTTIACYFYALSKISMDEYEKIYKKEIHLDKLKPNFREYMISLDKFIRFNDRNELNKLRKEQVRFALIDILEDETK